jgi:NADH:ubiquinone reductase (H+-translocating)
MRVVIIGAGFAGLEAAKRLGRHFKVTIIDNNDHFTIKPFLYEYMVGSMPEEIVRIPIASALGRMAAHLKGIAKSVDLDSRQVMVMSSDRSAIIKVPYDYLLITSGAVPIMPSADKAMHPYDYGSATEIKDKMRDLRNSIANHGKASIAIIGGGPTGLETAFIIKEFMEYHSKKHHNANSHSVTIYNASDDILSNYSARLASFTRSQLVLKGVRVENFCNARRIEQKGRYCNVHFQRDGMLHAQRHDMAFVAAGVSKNSIGDYPLETDRFLRSKKNRHIFVAGDAAMIDSKRRKVPMLAKLAQAQGRIAAINIMRASRSRKLIPYKPKVRGVSIITGRREGISIIGKKIILRGTPGWLVSRMSYLQSYPSLNERMHAMKTLIRPPSTVPYDFLDSEE